MPSLLVRFLLAAMCLCTHPAWALTSDTDGTLMRLGDAGVSIGDTIQTWVDVAAQAKVAQVAANPQRFSRTSSLERLPLDKNSTLWIKLRISRENSAANHWVLNIPLPNLDEVALYQADATGGWTAQRAGDTLPQGNWARPGLYPEFDLHLPDTEPKDVYLEIRNFQPLVLPIRINSAHQRERQRQIELLLQGLLLGALLPMALLSLLRYAEHHKLVDAAASGFALLMLATVGQSSGLMNTFIWDDTPQIGNYAASVVPVLAAGFVLLFIRSVFGVAVHFRLFDRLLAGVGWGTVLWALGLLVLDRLVAERTSAFVLVFTSFVSLFAIFLSWRGGSSTARWLVVALAPQFLGHLLVLLDNLGVAPAFWEMRYLTSIAIATTVPILLYALSQLTHDRKELVIRANHLPTQDALTGLLTQEVFQTHLAGAVARAIESREPIALALVRVINHGHIRRDFGDTTAEQCLLRAVVKLQRILRDLDPAGRVGTAQFALLMEGINNRESLNERMVKLIASGLMPLPGLVPEVTLHFQVGCVLLHENPVAAERVLDDLRDLMASMSPNSRRPIRFLEALPTEVAVMHFPKAST